MLPKTSELLRMFASDKVLLLGICLSWKCFVLPDNPSIAPETSRNEVHFANELNNMLIKWSLVVNFLIYLSDLCFRLLFEIISSSMREISCPKTDVPKKCVLLSMQLSFVVKTKLQKESGRFNYLPTLIFYRTTMISNQSCC